MALTHVVSLSRTATRIIPSIKLFEFEKVAVFPTGKCPSAALIAKCGIHQQKQESQEL
jgi:hypothetical protein